MQLPEKMQQHAQMLTLLKNAPAPPLILKVGEYKQLAEQIIPPAHTVPEE